MKQMNRVIKVIDSRLWQKTYKHQDRLWPDDMKKVGEGICERMNNYFIPLYRSMFKESLGNN